MDVKDTLYNLANATDELHVTVEDLSQALGLWQERIDSEGYQDPKGEWDHTKAVCFVRRFPSYMAQHRIFLEYLDTITATLKKLSDESFDAYKRLKEEGEKTNAD